MLTVQHDTIVAELRRQYLIRDDPSVRAFLDQHPALLHLLSEAAPRLQAAFGKSSVVSLEAAIDSEGTQTLYAAVLWPGKSSEVRQALAEFDESWWLAHAAEARGYLTFTYQLV